jgi:hypothetical protein
MATLTTTATVAAFSSSPAFIVTASLLAAALIAYLIYALVTGKSKPASPVAPVKDPASVTSNELSKESSIPTGPQADSKLPAGNIEQNPEANAQGEANGQSGL